MTLKVNHVTLNLEELKAFSKEQDATTPLTRHAERLLKQSSECIKEASSKSCQKWSFSLLSGAAGLVLPSCVLYKTTPVIINHIVPALLLGSYKAVEFIATHTAAMMQTKEEDTYAEADSTSLVPYDLQIMTVGAASTAIVARDIIVGGPISTTVATVAGNTIWKVGYSLLTLPFVGAKYSFSKVYNHYQKELDNALKSRKITIKQVEDDLKACIETFAQGFEKALKENRAKISDLSMIDIDKLERAYQDLSTEEYTLDAHAIVRPLISLKEEFEEELKGLEKTRLKVSSIKEESVEDDSTTEKKQPFLSFLHPFV